ncbi:tetratricopeptide repeat protein [Oceaniglobus indicus]|uniref:tetratricopeptide repeat protein n=1 Tax=Oceaniglobus indicus TaxID=2047749 RepID=UPI000C188ECB|nr:tetratricopeptide repeat protein [Oceaniglobus indicus]
MPTRLSFRRLAVSVLALGVVSAGAITPHPSAAGPEAGINAGAYMAARQASIHNDFQAAAMYFSRALARDPKNPAILEFATSSYLGLGDVARATTIARQMVQIGLENQIANLVIIGEAAKGGDWGDILNDLESGQTVGPLFDGLLKAWALVGDAQHDAAMAQFDTVASSPGVRAFGLYHKALALASRGDYAGADAILSDPADGGIPLSRRGIVAHVQILSQLDRQAEALALLQDAFGANVDRALEELIARLTRGERLPFDVTPTAVDGVAEVYFSIANALRGEASANYTLLYARMASHLRPGHIDASLLTAGILDNLDLHDLAIEVYATIPETDSAWDAAELGRARALRRGGDVDGAIGVLRDLTRARPDLALLEVTLGDFLREEQRYAEAIPAYDAAIELFEEDEQGQWIVYFARAIALERLDRWPEAEADFRKALELNPDEPQVLNYLGYSYVEKEGNLDEALDMIRRAAAARPQSGAIADSLGWVYYRLGRYEEAVAPMERAVELMPVDAVVNDHLGDVYWAVGRELEARFQWKRALSFVKADDPDNDVDPDRIRRKLEVGLDRVLEEEGEDPLKVASDG